MSQAPVFEVYCQGTEYWLAVPLDQLNNPCHMLVWGSSTVREFPVAPKDAKAKILDGSLSKSSYERINRCYRYKELAGLRELGFPVIEAVAKAAQAAPEFGLSEAAVLTAAFGSNWPAGVGTTKSNQSFVLPDSPVVTVIQGPWNI